ncbi:MAG: glycosyl hydrolase family 28 protein [Prevotella sp.]|nr:glycosyl hydrolase family 28 protein [Prevotella sp.]
MKKFFILILTLAASLQFSAKTVNEKFPNGEDIPEWFNDTTRIDINSLGEQYIITDYGVEQDSSLLQTVAIQNVIDLAAEKGGGVIVIPAGKFLSGALFFKQGTHLHLCEGAELKGIDAIKYYPIIKTRMEGQSLNYFAALVNAEGIDGFTITGKGTINGNGLRFWEEFWIRRQFNPQCTNLEALRPRLVYMQNCSNVQVQDVRLINSPFWTNHLYKCDHVKYIGCYIYAPTSGVKAPSSDALDIDNCHDILVSGCYMNVNDDAVVLKGGKGTFADQDPENGPNYNIIVQNCTYGKVHGCLTLGSESLHDWNIVVRNISFTNASRVLWLKMRPDTPQLYEQITVENVSGECGSFLTVRPWTQFYNLEHRVDMPHSECKNVIIKGINVNCNNFFDVGTSDKYSLSDFSFINCVVNDKTGAFDKTMIEGTVVDNLKINGEVVK